MTNSLEITNNTVKIKKNFMKNMQVPVKIYASKPLQDVLFDEHETLQNDSSFAQLAYIATLPNIKAVYGLPDLHQGYGFPIGSVAAFDLDGIISPEGVGFDINCGVRCYSTNLTADELESKKEKLAELLYDAIPVGIGPNTHTNITLQDLNSILDKGINHFVENGLCNAEETDLIESNGSMPGNSKLVSQKAKGKGLTQISSLGSGNHYLEVQYVDEIYDDKAADAMNITKKGQIVFMIHTGSRGLGHQVGTDYIDKINKEKIRNYNNFDEAKNLDKKNNEQINDNESGLAFIEYKSKIGQEYYTAMCSAANFAFCNRFLIGNTVNKIFASVFDNYKSNLIYDVCHNIAKIEKHIINDNEIDVIVHRKGASRSFPPYHSETPKKYHEHGQPVFIGGSMGTCSYILTGQKDAMTKSLGTACHGAGRIVPRGKAHKLFTYENIIKELTEKGIVVKCKSEKGLIEEAPDCYKDVHIVVDVCEKENIAKKVVRVKPLIVIKG
ncbi:hypothetical protein BDAP_000033 [Binucleata daphniae]